MAIYLIPGSLGSWNALAVKNECASGQRWFEVYAATFYLNCCVSKLLTKQRQRKNNYLNETYSIQAGSKGTLVWNYNTEHGQQLLERTYNKKYFGIKN